MSQTTDTGLSNRSYDILRTLGKELIFYIIQSTSISKMLKMITDKTWLICGKQLSKIEKSIHVC